MTIYKVGDYYFPETSLISVSCSWYNGRNDYGLTFNFKHTATGVSKVYQFMFKTEEQSYDFMLGISKSCSVGRILDLEKYCGECQ